MQAVGFAGRVGAGVGVGFAVSIVLAAFSTIFIAILVILGALGFSLISVCIFVAAATPFILVWRLSEMFDAA